MQNPIRRRELVSGYFVTIFVVAAFLLNFPVLGIFKSDWFVAGIPSLYVYIFSVWAILVIVSFALIEKKQYPNK